MRCNNRFDDCNAVDASPLVISPDLYVYVRTQKQLSMATRCNDRCWDVCYSYYIYPVSFTSFHVLPITSFHYLSAGYPWNFLTNLSDSRSKRKQTKTVIRNYFGVGRLVCSKGNIDYTSVSPYNNIFTALFAFTYKLIVKCVA